MRATCETVVVLVSLRVRNVTVTRTTQAVGGGKIGGLHVSLCGS